MTTLKLTSQQMDAFDGELLQDFRAFMLDRLREDPSDGLAGQTNEQLLAFIDDAIKRARAYGATTQVAYGMFLSAMVMLGADFDTSGAYPWAQAALADKTFTDANARMDNLMMLVAQYFDDTGGDQSGTERSMS